LLRTVRKLLGHAADAAPSAAGDGDGAAGDGGGPAPGGAS